MREKGGKKKKKNIRAGSAKRKVERKEERKSIILSTGGGKKRSHRGMPPQQWERRDNRDRSRVKVIKGKCKREISKGRGLVRERREKGGGSNDQHGLVMG